ncbi:Pr6Pr family membrane protein [Agromyces seonyuensis]|uniref:Pr6Pr family membrane protein n=1 Tax=Agromyces seonyuensis TaxID=2662446 RepID=A0A6I4P2V3_9MICO|nr:Pr6Pr family membrane protein [Agromyces seonyuensis]MWB99962.1 hypothetical protein [Agromyces seonyuensis]
MTARTHGLVAGEARVRRGLGIARLTLAVIEIVALIGNYEYVLGFQFAVANFYSYFTIQSAILLVLVLLVAAAFAFVAPVDPPWLGVVRTIVTIYVLISGIVFGLIAWQSASFGVRVDVPWSDTLLHFVMPVLVIVVWSVDAVLAINPPLPWTTLGWVLVLPVCWLVYTLWRGGQVGWYPYFFLDETLVGGYWGVAGCCFAVLLVFLGLTWGFTGLHRMLWRRGRVRRTPGPQPSPDSEGTSPDSDESAVVMP